MGKHVIVISRGHSGSRIIPNLLMENGFYFGSHVSRTGEYWGPKGKGKNSTWDNLIQAYMDCGTYASCINEHEWNFRIFDQTKYATPSFQNAVNNFYGDIIKYEGKRGWKLPEACFGYPFLVKMFEKAYFIHLVRHPVDVMAVPHGTDVIHKWKVPLKNLDKVKADKYLQRMLSVKYQFDIVEKTERPKNFLRVRMEDLIETPYKEKKRLQNFLGVMLKNMIPMNKDAAYRHSRNSGAIPHIFNDMIRICGYAT